MNYIRNIAKLVTQKRLLDPLVAIYYITTHCNLNCSYCEDFGAHKNIQNEPPAAPEDAKHIMRIIRSGVDSLWLTGGEPLLVPHLPDLLDFAKHTLKFRQISLISNGTLLPSREDILPYVDRLVISLDSLSPAAWSALNMPASYADNILSTVIRAARLQNRHNFRLILNTVITPEGLQNGYDMLIDFCAQYEIRISFSPQSTNNWPRYELITNPAYRTFIEKLIAQKKQGAPIMGSLAYLETLRNDQPYDCYPTLAPRIMPNGDLTYPCRPIEKAGSEHGGRPVNLREVKDWQTAMQIARQVYGDPPNMCVSCFQQCYAEPSLMQTKPLSYLREGNDLVTFVPG